tara:strand:+ start:88 stop:726 length:639 start_codon:yes stop_codon:yes gene_type:complete
MHETFSPLYRQVFESFGPGSGTRRTQSHQQLQQQLQLIKDAEARASNEGRPITGYRTLDYEYGRFGNKQSMQIPMFGQTEEERLAPIRAAQEKAQREMQESYEKQQADIAKNLKIVQEEKSAVSRLMEDYTALTIKEAEARRKAEEDRRTALKTSTQNRLMEGQSASLRINPTESGPRTGGGSQQFRRRLSQFGATAPYKGLNLIAPGAVNI